MSTYTFVTNTEDLRGRLEQLRTLVERAFSPDTSVDMSSGWTPSEGQCAAVAAIVHEEFGGEFVSAHVEGTSHWFNRISVGESQWDIDLTGDQFGRQRVQIAQPGFLYSDTRVRRDEELLSETAERAVRLATKAGLTTAARGLRRRFGNYQ